MESITTNGVLTPVLVRPLGMDTYEMISGHRRMHAAKLAGLEKIPTIIREMTDDEAVICMVDANVQREELLPSEKEDGGNEASRESRGFNFVPKWHEVQNRSVDC